MKDASGDMPINRNIFILWCASFVVIGVMILLCHLFHDWAKWFPVVTEPEFILIWFPKPVIVSLNVFLFLAIIVCLRIRNMWTVQRSINKLKMLINKALPEESVVLHIYSRSVITCWSKHVACSETFRFKLQA